MRRTYVEDEDDVPDIIPDGATLRVPLLLHDNARRLADHQPGYRGVTDAAVRAERARWIKQISDAWRMDARRKKPPDDDDDDDDELNNNNDRRRRGAADARAAATASYHQMCARLRDSWRMNPGVARAEPRIVGAGPKSMVVDPDNGGEPDASTQLLRGAPASADDPGARMRRHLATESTAGAQAKRDAVWEQYRRSLDYRTRGQTNPANATAIEAQRERWLGK
jgi:hypothetical protein